MKLKNKKFWNKIEEIGKVFKKFNLTPIIGKFSLFPICDSHEKLSDELIYFSLAIKNSISNSLFYHPKNKIIDYNTFSSDKEDIFS
jgi:hypothetical protein